MVGEMGKLDMASMKVRERIAASVRCRLKVLAPHREAVRRGRAPLELRERRQVRAGREEPAAHEADAQRGFVAHAAREWRLWPKGKRGL